MNAQDGNNNWNAALHLAIERNELKVVSLLLSQGVDTTITNGDGKMPLYLVEERNNFKVTDAL